MITPNPTSYRNTSAGFSDNPEIRLTNGTYLKWDFDIRPDICQRVVNSHKNRVAAHARRKLRLKLILDTL